MPGPGFIEPCPGRPNVPGPAGQIYLCFCISQRRGINNTALSSRLPCPALSCPALLYNKKLQAVKMTDTTNTQHTHNVSDDDPTTSRLQWNLAQERHASNSVKQAPTDILQNSKKLAFFSQLWHFAHYIKIKMICMTNVVRRHDKDTRLVTS